MRPVFLGQNRKFDAKQQVLEDTFLTKQKTKSIFPYKKLHKKTKSIFCMGGTEKKN